MKTEVIKISLIKSNPNNPRIIKDDKFRKLVNSIKEFPKMLEIRPIVVNDEMIVLGGNMRLKACIDAGLKEVHIIKASDLSEDEQRQFIIKDNANFGDWDIEALADWNSEELEEWGVEIPNFEAQTDYSDKNKEIDTDDFSDKMTLKFELTSEEFVFVNETLSRLNANKELALLKLLKYEQI